MARALITDETQDNGRYFRPSSALEFFSSGCRLLDCALGGGWPLTRMSNIIGDQSTGKTLLAIEATNSFAKQFPSGKIRYAEAEAAFDQDYAASIGMPIERISFTEDNEELVFDTVEDFYNDYNSFLKECESENQPGLYILDSLDALSDAAEMARGFDEGSYQMNKAKQMGKLFRMVARETKRTRCHLMIVSQERDNIGVTFGAKSKRSGGRALGFYVTHELWLARKEVIRETVSKMKRATGILIRAQVKKNKVSVPLKEVEFQILFQFGIDEFNTCLDYLDEVGYQEDVFSEHYPEMKKSSFIKWFNEMPDAEYWEQVKKLGDITAGVWAEVEDRFRPTRSRV